MIMKKIIPILAVLLMMAGCRHTKDVPKENKSVTVDIAEASINENDSFFVVYRQPVETIR